MKTYISGLVNYKSSPEDLAIELEKFLHGIREEKPESTNLWVWLYHAPWSYLIMDRSNKSASVLLKEWMDYNSEILRLSRKKTRCNLRIINIEKTTTLTTMDNRKISLSNELREIDTEKTKLSNKLTSTILEEVEPSCWDIYEELESIAWHHPEDSRSYSSLDEQDYTKSFEMIELIKNGLNFNKIEKDLFKLKTEQNIQNYKYEKKLSSALEENKLLLNQTFTVQEELEKHFNIKNSLTENVEKLKNKLTIHAEKFKQYRSETNEKFRERSQEYKEKIDLAKEARINLQKKLAAQSDLIKELKNQHKETLNQLAQSKKEIDELQSVKTQAFETINAAEKTLHRARKIILELAAKSSL